MWIKIIIFISSLCMLVSCSSYVRNDLLLNYDDKEDMHKMLYYASLAGSSHNSQPWKVDVFGKDSILIYADTSRKLTVVDPQSRELYISIGAFIENLDIAARSLGYTTSIKITDTNFNPNIPVAKISLIKGNARKIDEGLKEIEMRSTIRIPFDTLEINQTDWESLVSINSSNIHFLPASSEKGQFVKQKELEAFTKQSYNKLAQEELVNWIRFSNKDIKEKRDGLTPSGMGISGIRGFIVGNFYSPEDSKKESFIEKGIEKTKNQIENCGGWIILTQETNNISGLINSGRLYERVSLKCRKMSIGFHPMNQIIEEPDIEEKVTSYLGIKSIIIFIARIGYVNNYPVPVSLRRPVESFAIFK